MFRKNATSFTWAQKLEKLPRTLDRFRATRVFFDLEYPSFLISNINARKWTSWASLSALASILEVLEYEFDDLDLLNKWKQSVELREIKSDITLAVLKELRNYEMHIEYQKRLSHLEVDKELVNENVDHDSFFFSQIKWEKFRKLNNIKNGRSIVDQTAISDFNQYAEKYSVETIINQTLEWLAEIIDTFVQRSSTPQ